MHLQEKICQDDQIVRHWDQAQTPYQRLVATGTLESEQQARLQAMYEQTNPLALRQEIYRLLAALWEALLRSPASPKWFCFTQERRLSA